MISEKDIENQSWSVFHPGGDGYLPLIGAELKNLPNHLDPFNHTLPDIKGMQALDAITHFTEIHHPKFGSIKLVIFGKE